MPALVIERTAPSLSADIYDFFKAWSETDELTEENLALVEATVVK